MAFSFLKLDLFLLLSGEHEDDRDTLCMVPWVKRGRGFRCLRSFITALFHIIIFITRERGVCFSFTRHPFISLLIVDETSMTVTQRQP